MRALAVALVAAASLAAPATSATTGPSFAFGRGGGNIMPLDVRIAPSGRVTVDGKSRRTLTQARLQALPDPAREVFARWVLKTFDVVEVVVVESTVERLEALFEFAEIHEPTALRLNRPGDVEGYSEGVAV